MRDLGKVLEQVLRYIPDDFPDRNHVENRFQYLSETIKKYPEEMESYWWQQAYEYVFYTLGYDYDDNPPWKIHAKKCFIGRTEPRS